MTWQKKSIIDLEYQFTISCHNPYHYVCIDYLGSEKSKVSDLHLGCTGSNKHNGMDYNNVLGIGIPGLLLNLLSCHGFLKNNDSVVIIKCPNRMSKYYFNKIFVELECE